MNAVCGPPRVLMSYGVLAPSTDIGDIVARQYAGRTPSILADSGAWTTNKLGKVMDPAAYARWLDRWGRHFDFAISLDVIHDVEGSWRSHQNIEQLAGRRLMPVVHYPEGPATFERYRQHGHEMIGVGGLAIQGRHDPGTRYRWLIGLFRWAAETGVRFHGLGVGSFNLIYGLPWYSVDSSAWAKSYLYARVPLFDGERGVMREAVTRTRTAYQPRNVRLLRQRGYDPASITENFNMHDAGTIAADSYQRAEAWVRARRPPVPPPGDGLVTAPEPDGLRVYLTVRGENDMRLVTAPKPAAVAA